MIRHIVLWKLDDAYSPDEKLKIKKQLNEKLLNLLNYIDELRHLEVNYNSVDAVASNFDVMLDTKFETMEDLKTYQVHPEHLKVVEYVKTLNLKRAAIDYEI
jgi:predicted metal-binding transcription factor (methanogenesis marker protein 9)